MKIIIKEFKRNFRQDFLLYISIIITSLLCFLIFASNTIIENKNEIRYNNRITYTLISPDNNTDYFISLSEKDYIKSLFISYKLPKDFNPNEGFSGEIRLQRRIYADACSEQKVYDGHLPSISSRDNEIGLPLVYAMANDIKVGDSINFLGKELTVVALTDAFTTNRFISNLKVLNDLDLEIDRLEVGFSNDLSDVRCKEIVEELNNKLSPRELESSAKFFLSANSKYLPAIIQIIILSTLSLVFIYTHILNNRRKKYFIFRFNGMTKKNFYAMLLWELIIVYLFSFIAAILIFYVFDYVILRSIFKIIRYDLRFSSIAIVFISYLLILLIFMFFNIRRYFKKSLVESYKEA